jgi:prephenate dehydrogenase
MVNLGDLRVAVVGTGLMGCSVGLAAKRAGVQRVTAFDSDPAALALAVERGAVDRPVANLAEAVAQAGLVVIATPVGTIAARASEALVSSRSGCTVTDVGSTKAGICAALAGESRFVGGHPLSGSELQGPGGASADLFLASRWFLTPLPATDSESYRLVTGFVEALGAEPVAIDPEAHDELVALTSHLPHALANLLVNQAGGTRIAGADTAAGAGSSFRDLTRVAGANPRIWADIFLDNAAALGGALAEHRRQTEELEELLRRRDSEELMRWIEEAARARRRLAGG